MTEYLFDHDRLDVYRLFSYAAARVEVDVDRSSEAKHKQSPLANVGDTAPSF